MRLLTLILLVAAAPYGHGGGPTPDSQPLATQSQISPGPPAAVNQVVAAVPTAARTKPAANISAPPRPYRASYSANYNGMAINTERTFKAEGKAYALSTRASNFLGSISEEEILTFADDGSVLSATYDYQRAILGNKRDESTRFERGNREVVNTYKKKTVRIPLSDDLHAPLGYQLQMRRDLQAGQREFHYQVVSRGKIRDYRYVVDREEVIDTPLGKIETLVIERERDTDERQTFLWLAKKFDYLPVKLVHREDGDSHEMLIKSYTSDMP